MPRSAEVVTLPREDGDDHARGGLIVDFFRLDASRRLVKALAVGALIMSLGSIAIALALALTHLDTERPLHARAMRPGDGVMRSGQVLADGTPVTHDWLVGEAVLGLLGLGCILLGGGSAIVRLNKVLSEEEYLALRTDGAYLRIQQQRELLRWEHVSAVRWDSDRAALVFELHDGEEWVRGERFAGIDGPELAKRASEVRRKALFGLL